MTADLSELIDSLVPYVPVEGHWDDVLRRAGVRAHDEAPRRTLWRGTRVRAIALACIVLLIVVFATPAFGLRGVILDLFRGSDINSAAHRLAPPGSRIVLAQELDATYGVVAYTRGSRTEALALQWRDKAWRRVTPGRIRLTLVEPRPGATIKRASVLAHIRSSNSWASGPAGLWLDGRPTRFDVATPGDGYVVIENTRPGRHVLIYFEAVGLHAAAAAWTFTFR
jgi:hypothetical protein